jgi:hypothetical protein
VSEAWHRDFIREKVRMASIVMELMDRHAPHLKTSDKGAPDLVLTEA